MNNKFNIFLQDTIEGKKQNLKVNYDRHCCNIKILCYIPLIFFVVVVVADCFIIISNKFCCFCFYIIVMNNVTRFHWFVGYLYTRLGILKKKKNKNIGRNKYNYKILYNNLLHDSNSYKMIHNVRIYTRNAPVYYIND